ncbi:hypothetical protein Ade02nite_52450 [Paractinoplanes deccanensis]|uniref:AAA family ATPase n=1 Tax=Paractinoplanes deccanensis TaxID=113561 RepID=A0ABQ3Y9E4_9ACTN|nr:AAA family ATPase [Actinoplanes deccanensis]GID76604.1 hypothetical protein Ade02nite_52450 [Actinoplanes deccanensis]
MAEWVVLINGLPGSGKTTLARGLSAALGVPLISKDAIKDRLAAERTAASATEKATDNATERSADSAPAEIAELGAAASELMWELAAAEQGTVVLESWWFKPRDLGFVRSGLGRSGAIGVVEVWCEVSAEVARQRVERRRRPGYYEDGRRLAENWAEWSAGAEPLGVGTILRVRTDAPVDLASLTTAVSAGIG